MTLHILQLPFQLHLGFEALRPLGVDGGDLVPFENLALLVDLIRVRFFQRAQLLASLREFGPQLGFGGVPRRIRSILCLFGRGEAFLEGCTGRLRRLLANRLFSRSGFFRCFLCIGRAFGSSGLQFG